MRINVIVDCKTSFDCDRDSWQRAPTCHDDKENRNGCDVPVTSRLHTVGGLLNRYGRQEPRVISTAYSQRQLTCSLGKRSPDNYCVVVFMHAARR